MKIDDPLLAHYAQVEEEVAKACLAAGRKRETVRLLAVSKFHTAEDIARLAQAGQRDFGENYVQEVQEKRKLLAAMPEGDKISWHLIGHVQRRKAKDVAGKFTLLHTLDSLNLATDLEKHLAQTESAQAALIEVNIGEEPQKAGIMPNEVFKLASAIRENCPHIHLQGLMCLPPVYDAGDAARPYFARLRQMRDKLAAELGLALPELSMGMSGDFAGAIAEGATIVRIGTNIFGPRPLKKPA